MNDIYGTDSNDVLSGTAVDDRFVPGFGLDTVDGGGGLDLIYENYSTTSTGDSRWRLTASNASGTSGVLGSTQSYYGYQVTFSNIESIDLRATGIFVIDGRLIAGPGTLNLVSTGAADRLELDLSALSVGVTFTVTGFDGAMSHGAFTGFESYFLTLTHMNDIVVGGDSQDVLGGQGGNDQLDGRGNSDSIYGHEGNDTIDGGGGNDLLFGGSGSDVMNGGDGSDFLHSSADLLAEGTVSRDVLNGGGGDDWLWAGYGDSEDGGGGTLDTITLDFHLAAAGQTINLAAAFSGGSSTIGTTTVTNVNRYYSIYATSGNDTIIIGEGGFHSGQTTSTDLQQGIRGLDGADNISGGAYRDLIHGGTGNDVIGGYGGDDELRGEEGNDTITGGSGDDSIFGGGGVDALYGEDGNDTLIADAGTDLLVGGAGNDYLQLAQGTTNGINNRAYGGAGKDYYDYVDVGDLIFENFGEGIDTVFAHVSLYLAANVENLIVSAGGIGTYGVGNSIANALSGNRRSNLLLGGGGDDTVNGEGGDDSLFGQDGADALFGGYGIDYLVGGIGDDVIAGDEEADALYGEAGDDTLIGGRDFVTDIMVAGEGNDILYGDSGLSDYDRMDGGNGNDLYYVDTGNDLTFEAVSGGIDTVIATIPGQNNGVYLYAHVENLVLAGSTAFGVGNELNNELTGNESTNWLLGGAGDDVINGKTGNDVLFGQTGADIFVFQRGTGGDVVGDFVIAQDKIEIVGIFASFDEMRGHFVQVGSDGAIDLGYGDTVVMTGVTMANLTASDFLIL
ncbi:MAG: hypothetical protein V4579_14490 [Pseudomonadota bacterium]